MTSPRIPPPLVVLRTIQHPVGATVRFCDRFLLSAHVIVAFMSCVSSAVLRVACFCPVLVHSPLLTSGPFLRCFWLILEYFHFFYPSRVACWSGVFVDNSAHDQAKSDSHQFTHSCFNLYTEFIRCSKCLLTVGSSLAPGSESK